MEQVTKLTILEDYVDIHRTRHQLAIDQSAWPCRISSSLAVSILQTQARSLDVLQNLIIIQGQLTSCGRLNKGILELDDEGMCESAEYTDFPQDPLGLLRAAQHVGYPLDRYLASSKYLQ